MSSIFNRVKSTVWGGLVSGATLLLLTPFHGQVGAQGSEGEASRGRFDGATLDLENEIQKSVAELNELREAVAAEQVPLSKKLTSLESDLIGVREEFEQAARLLDNRTLGLANLGKEIKSREDEITYLSTLLSDYLREFEARLHIVERQRYAENLEEATLAAENTRLSDQEIFESQAKLFTLSIDRLFESLGGTRFEGRAVGQESGLVSQGTFLLVGPTALFRSNDGESVGLAMERINSAEPAQVVFADPEETLLAGQLVASGRGTFPLDPTLGDAHKVESIDDETFYEHVEKGGLVMIPIFTLAGLALLIALFKWVSMIFIRRPSRKSVEALLDAIDQKDEEAAGLRAREIRGPVGRMLAAGVEHLREPRELIEEVMYETVLTTRLKLQRMLPFIAICAASAPLLGLLGTVTGIIATFKLITVFGSGDVKSLSGGISEALITTKFGLIVAIPSLLIHAFLSRKARGVIGQMESAAVSFLNQVSKTPLVRRTIAAPRAEEYVGAAAPDPTQIQTQVREILGDLLGPLMGAEGAAHGNGGLSGGHSSPAFQDSQGRRGVVGETVTAVDPRSE